LIKKSSLALANTSAVSRILTALERVDKGGNSLLRVLTYHRVDELDARPNLSPSLLSATPDDFSLQMHFLAENYTPISVRHVLEYIEMESALPSKAVLVTFDDAYCDFAQHAWGILKQYGIPVTLFVPTAYPDNPKRILWWDKLHFALRKTERDEITSPVGIVHLATPKDRRRAFKHLRNHIKSLAHDEAMQLVDELCDQLQIESSHDNAILSWASLRQLAAEGVTLGAHTRTHPLLNRISMDEAEQEAVKSQQDLQQHIGDTMPIFAYPSGSANEAIAARLVQAGFKLAFTTERGINDMTRTNPLLIRRINVGSSTSVNVMHVQMLSDMVYLNRFWD
jgi:peptidoglycan/xylan/chitin deacetylase (PgdA/CDA1 family)